MELFRRKSLDEDMMMVVEARELFGHICGLGKKLNQQWEISLSPELQVIEKADTHLIFVNHYNDDGELVECWGTVDDYLDGDTILEQLY